MKSGPRDDLITIERFTVTEDAFGGTVQNWAFYSQEWVDVEYGGGKESREAGLEGADQTAIFWADSNPSSLAITTKDRLKLNGHVWDITQSVPYSRDRVRITAVNRASAQATN